MQSPDLGSHGFWVPGPPPIGVLQHGWASCFEHITLSVINALCATLYSATELSPNVATGRGFTHGVGEVLVRNTLIN